MIDEILKEHWPFAAYPGVVIDKEGLINGGPSLELLTAIYEIGLGVIDNLEPPKGLWSRTWMAGFSTAKDEHRKAWAKACGVAEK